MSGVLLKSTLRPIDFDDCDALGSRPVYYIQEAQVYLNFKQEHKYLLIVAIKKGVVNDNA